jgi:ceramide synthetase
VRPWKGQAPDNPTLEKAYLVARKGRLNYKQIQGLAKQLDWTERQVERWIRMRRMMDRPSTLVKFMECGWRFSYYGFVFAYGVWTLWDKDWLWDINNCWYTFPHQVNQHKHFSTAN